jgi:hypothetical protein
VAAAAAAAAVRARRLVRLWCASCTTSSR